MNAADITPDAEGRIPAYQLAAYIAGYVAVALEGARETQIEPDAETLSNFALEAAYEEMADADRALADRVLNLPSTERLALALAVHALETGCLV